MRAAPVVALVCLLGTSLLPVVPAQAPDALLNDPADDVVLQADSTVGVVPPVPFNNEATKPVDLLGLGVEEAEGEVVFTLQAASFQVNQGGTDYHYVIMFTWGATTIRVACPLYGAILGEVRSNDCTLSSQSAQYGGGYGSHVPASWDFQANTVTVRVPKVDILDGEGKAPTRGDTLEGIHVRSFGDLVFLQGFTAFARDRMPDTGGGNFTLVLGDEQHGHLALATNDRVRVSNGGATTFVFRATLTNLGDTADVVDLLIKDAPEGWNVSVDSPVPLPENASVPLTILASLPFEHHHGGFTSFNLTATSQKAPASWASLMLGVRHTPIPQPTGHHAELFLHGGQGSESLIPGFYRREDASMNTLSDHEGDAPEIPSTGRDSGARWEIPLDPQLRVGVDFDVNRTGTLEGKIRPRSGGIADLVASVYLVAVSENDDKNRYYSSRSHELQGGILLARGEVPDLALDLQNEVPFAVTLVPTREADYIAYAPHRNLVLAVELVRGEINACCVPGAEPTLLTEPFRLALPLEEYHDRLTGLPEVAAAIDLRAEGDVERLGRPGTVMTYAFRLTNTGNESVTVAVDVAGTDAHLGSVVPSGEITLEGGQSRPVTLAVDIPADATEGTELEVLLFAHARDDPTKTALARTKTTVTLGAAAAPDGREAYEAAKAAEEENDTPLPAPGILLGAVAVLAALMRRRGR